MAQVLKGTPNARLSESSQGVRTFSVSIERNRGGFTGKLVVLEGANSTLARSVRGEKCEPIAKALVFSTVLAIDPSATPELEEEPASVGGNADSSTEPSAVPSSPAHGEPHRPETVSEADHQAEAPAQASPRSSVHGLGVFAGPNARTGTSPGITFGASLSLERQSGALLSAFGGELAYYRARMRSIEGASSSLQYLLIGPLGCGPAWQWRDVIRLAPCLSFEFGLVDGEGEGLPVPRTEQRWWSALKLPVHLMARLSDVICLRAEAGPTLALTRYRFVFTEPQTDIYEVSMFGVAAALKLGLRL